MTDSCDQKTYVLHVKDYIDISRPDHWFKNIFVLPGTVLAAILTQASFDQIAWPLIIGLISSCFIASANYVINEWLDAEFDRFHPVKKNRPSVTGNLKVQFVYFEYILFAVAGLSLALSISTYFLITQITFLLMGVLYNVKPFRTKDKVLFDVLSESINNPIRLTLGWFIVTSRSLPPSSLLIGYWMGGAFLMAVKRYAEFRFIGDTKIAGLYRRSFQFYSEKSLLISTFFYASCSSFFLGVFLVKYRVELLLTLPFFALFFTWYLYIGMKPNSPVQNPERLYREKSLMIFMVFLIIIVSVVLFIDMPWLNYLLNNEIIHIGY
jgi:4-hydroxybenzoate polyprenyltransferase